MDRFAVMETFVRVAEVGSFSVAARDLGIGQPAVSKAVAALEQHIGIQLLLRSTRRLSLTEAGDAFYKRARRLLEEAEEAEQAARGVGARLSGRLRISAAVTLARLHIIPRVDRFLAANPDLSIEFLLNDKRIDLIREGVDVAFRTGSLTDSCLTARKLATCRRHVVGAPTYFDQAGLPHAPADLQTHSAIVYTQGCGGAGGDTWTLRRGERVATVTLATRLRVSAAEGVRAAVIGGLGLAVASEWMFAPEIASGAVRPTLEDWELPGLDLWSIFPEGRRASVKARAFAQFVQAMMRPATSNNTDTLAAAAS
jgi:DNA-binding transcriptional LysR family regulator